MKLSIRMKIFLPVMLLLILFPLAAWSVFSYTLDGHVNYNARRDLDQMIRAVDEILEEAPGNGGGGTEEEKNALLSALREAAQTGAGGAKMLVLGGKYRVLYPRNYDDRPEMTLLYAEALTRMTGGGDSWKQGTIFEETIGDSRYLLYFKALEGAEEEKVQKILLYCPIQDTTVILDQVSRLILLIMGAMAAVSIVLLWFVAGSISGPVRRLSEAARGIGESGSRRWKPGPP